MKNKTKKIKSNDDYNYEGIEDINKDISKICINNENNFDDIFQKIDMLHKDYQKSYIFNPILVNLIVYLKAIFVDYKKTDNENRRS